LTESFAINHISLKTGRWRHAHALSEFTFIRVEDLSLPNLPLLPRQFWRISVYYFPFQTSPANSAYEKIQGFFLLQNFAVQVIIVTEFIMAEQKS
jgi:hypothetical protein